MCVCVCTEEDFLLSQAALLEQVSSLQPLLDSTYIRGESCKCGLYLHCCGGSQRSDVSR